MPMPMPLHRTPTWLLLLPSLAVGAAIYHIDEPLPAHAAPLVAPAPPLGASVSDSLDQDIAMVAGIEAPTARPGAVAAAQSSSALAARPATGRALYEPARGAYLGVAVDAEAAKGDPQVLAGLMSGWNARSGRKHALQLGTDLNPECREGAPRFSDPPWVTWPAPCRS